MIRADVKEAHEKAVLNNFIGYCSNCGVTVKVISRPEPPDAIVTIDGIKTWIEITDAFYSPELAESITTYVADDKLHKPVPKEKRLSKNPDEKFSSILESVIVKKYDKDSIGNVYKKHGCGILLVGVMSPFSDVKDLINTEKQKILKAIKSKDGRFNEIYLYSPHSPLFHKLL